MTKPKAGSTYGKRAPRESTAVIKHTSAELAKQGHRYPELFDTKDKIELLALALKAQNVLPMSRRRTRKSLYSAVISQPQFFESTLEKMKAAMVEFPTTAELPKPKRGGVQGAHIVRWKDFETALVAFDERVLALINKPDYEPPNERLIDAIMQAQMLQLPSERHRSRAGLMQSQYNKRLLPVLRECLKEAPPFDLKSLSASAAAPEAPAIESTPSASEPVAVASEIGLADAFAVIFKAIGPAIRRTLVDVAREVAREVLTAPRPDSAAPSVDTIAQAVKSAVYDVVGGPAPAPVPEAPAPPVQAQRSDTERQADEIAERLLRVDVVGLNGSNASAVRERMGDKFDLRFLDPEQAMRREVTAPTVIVCRRFISHAAEKRINGERVIYADGAAPSVVRHLRSLITTTAVQ